MHKITLDPNSQKFYIRVVLRCNKAKRAPLQKKDREGDWGLASRNRMTKQLTD